MAVSNRDRPSQPITRGTVIYSAISQRLRYRAGEMGLFAVLLEDRQWFFSPQQPMIYNRRNEPIPPHDITAGSFVAISVNGNG